MKKQTQQQRDFDQSIRKVFADEVKAKIDELLDEYKK